MKLVTFEFEGKESWGFVVTNPADQALWVYEPGKVDKQLQLSATMTNGYSVSMPKFMKDSVWPESLVDFLALEEEGMAVLQKLETFLLRFLKQSDEGRMTYCGHPLNQVHLRAPIPRPRLMWGLVQNCPTFVRSNPKRQSTNLYPQGHQRPMGSVVGCGEPFVHPMGAGYIAFNVELGVVIGKKGRYIPVNKAMDYVAGYTVVTDSSTRVYTNSMQIGEGDNVYEKQAQTDWYVGATMSWGGKMTDAHCAMGPYLTTKDEIGNIYDLLVYTKMSGHLRDRAHTSAHLLGVERVIQWYSSFATLYPGDVIHLGTLGTDGLSIPEEFIFNGPDCTIDSEIEDVGYLKCPTLNLNQGDWRADDDESKTIHESPAVRDIIKSGKGEIQKASDWKLSDARQYYTLFKNYKQVQEEGIRILETPRFLCAPNSAITLTGSEVELPPRSNDLDISIELAAVIKKVAKGVQKENAEDFILGYLPMISLTDSSFDDVLVEPTTLQEKGLPLVYGRWADGFNVINEEIQPMSIEKVMNRKMTLSIQNQQVENNTSDYVCQVDKSLPFITQSISLLPGDVLTLGHTANRIHLKKDEIQDGMQICGEIEGLGKVTLTLKHSTAPDNSNPVNTLKL